METARSDVEHRIDRLEYAAREHNSRISDVERAMTELVATLRPVLTDYAYDKRRREEGRKAWSTRDRILLALVAVLALGMQATALVVGVLEHWSIG